MVAPPYSEVAAKFTHIFFIKCRGFYRIDATPLYSFQDVFKNFIQKSMIKRALLQRMRAFSWTPVLTMKMKNVLK